jgi:hypothetical protein
VALAATLMLATGAQTQKPELTRVHLGVGGKTSLYYLPLTVTEKLGYFKDVGLDVEISEFQGGAKSPTPSSPRQTWDSRSIPLMPAKAEHEGTGATPAAPPMVARRGPSRRTPRSCPCIAP